MSVMAILRQPLAVSIRQRSSIVGDYEVTQIPGILISLDLDLLGLLVYLQLACRQYGARALSIGGEDQLDGADAVVAGTRTAVQLAEGKVAIGDETESAPALGGQFDDVLDVVSHAPAGESDTALGLHVLEDIHKAVLAGAREGIDKRLPIVRRGKLLDVDVDVDNLAHLCARPHRGRLDRHAFLGLDGCADARQQGEEGNHKGVTKKPVHVSHIHYPFRGRRAGLPLPRSGLRAAASESRPLRAYMSFSRGGN